MDGICGLQGFCHHRLCRPRRLSAKYSSGCQPKPSPRPHSQVSRPRFEWLTSSVTTTLVQFSKVRGIGIFSHDLHHRFRIVAKRTWPVDVLCDSSLGEARSQPVDPGNPGTQHCNHACPKDAFSLASRHRHNHPKANSLEPAQCDTIASQDMHCEHRRCFESVDWMLVLDFHVL